MTVTVSTHVAALLYAQRGWPVFPSHSLRGGRCGCGRRDCASPGKHPLTRRGLHDATIRRDVIDRWWTRWPEANVSICTGARSRLVVVDIDPDHGGLASLRALEAEFGRLPATRSVRTGSGGLHHYFSHPGGRIRNNVGTLLGPGIDIRGEGGYVIGPPSFHASGARYEWLPTRQLAAPPAWLTHALTAAPDPSVPPPPPDPDRIRHDPAVSRWAAAAVRSELGRVAAAQPGQRNHTLNRAAFALGQLVGGGHLDRDEVAQLLFHVGLAAGLGARETHSTVTSGLTAGARTPRHPPERPFRLVRRPAPAPQAIGL